MEQLKENVKEFNENVADNGGYLYTTNASLSSILSNERISRAVDELIGCNTLNIIDIGAGDNAYTADIQRRKPNAKITAFDPAIEAVKIAKEKYPGIDFFCANLLDIDSVEQYTKGKRFEVGVIRGVLHHVSNPRLALVNSAKIADCIIIMEPNGNNPILKLIEKISPYHRKHEERSFSAKLLARWCREAGFKVDYLNYVGFVPFFFPTFLTKVIYFFQPFLEKIYLLKKYFGAQIIIRCIKT